MMELIQGEGGVLPQDPDFVKAVRALCDEKDLLLIIDEVQTGIGRTGSLFCFQQYGIQPDVVTMAKGLGGGLPVGAVMAAKTCCDVLGPGTHATTFGGSPTVCAAANAVLSIVNDDKFLAEVREKGAYLKDKILALAPRPSTVCAAWVSCWALSWTTASTVRCEQAHRARCARHHGRQECRASAAAADHHLRGDG